MNDRTLLNIVNRYGTPVYVYDGQEIEKQYHLLRKSIPKDFEILFSMKANPLLGLCQKLRGLGSGIEVASSGELYLAQKAGFKPCDIIFTSPGKTPEELEYAIQTGIYSINIESVEEAELINQIAGQNQKVTDISLRINPSFRVSGAGISMTGVPSQFGIDQSRLSEVMEVIRGLKNICVLGLHVYMGTQILDAENIIRNIDRIFNLAHTFSSTYGIKIRFLDLGGGFGVPYFPNEKELDMVRLKEGMMDLWENYRDHFADTRIVVESGRFLLAASGLFITKILYRKTCRDRTYLICDGGSNQHANSAFLGRFIRNNFPMRILGKNSGKEEPVYVSGPLCTPTDILGQNVLLPAADSGDYVVVEKSGAYGLTNSPLFFLGHPLPMEIIHNLGHNRVLRERGTREDFLEKQKPFR